MNNWGHVILEAGGEVDRAMAVQAYWDAVIKVPECPYPPTPQAMHPISNDLHSWYEQAGPDLFSSTYIEVVGGTTWHWLGTCLRLVPTNSSSGGELSVTEPQLPHKFRHCFSHALTASYSAMGHL